MQLLLKSSLYNTEYESFHVDDVLHTGLRGEGVAESRVAWIAKLSNVQGSLGNQCARTQGRQTVPRRLLAKLHQPERTEPQWRRVRNVRVSNFYSQFLSQQNCGKNGVTTHNYKNLKLYSKKKQFVHFSCTIYCDDYMALMTT